MKTKKWYDPKLKKMYDYFEKKKQKEFSKSVKNITVDKLLKKYK